ncbi:MAG TPA: terminase family protein, partial [archaeon]|nr:terminase family protein [archaeon]
KTRTPIRESRATKPPLPRGRGSDSPGPVPLYPYQQRWVRDRSRFKIAVKATQIGYSFAAALEAVLDCLDHRTLWIVLSRGERQSLEFMQKVREHAKAMHVIGDGLDIGIETSFFENADILQHEVKFPNGSRIIGLPANPDTARGYTGNMILDEFAFHQHDREIWAAAFGRVSRGDLKLRVLSTPNGCRGKYYELAKEVGLENQPQRTQRIIEGKEIRTASLRSSASSAVSPFSGHWCDVHTAVAQGCPIDVAALRQAIGDEETWQQEYECVFLASSANYIPLEMILECQSPEATAAFPAGWPHINPSRDRKGAGVPLPIKGQPPLADPSTPLRAGARGSDSATPYSLLPTPHSRELYFGYDVGRVRDLAVLAVVEKVGDVFWTRALLEMPGATFAAQEQVLRDVIPHCVRGAVDATGLGMEMAERLAAQFPGKVEPVTFTLARKQDLAIRMKRSFQERAIRIPDSRELRRDLNSVKRIVTEAGNIRFDAERDADHGHADRFWALALALHAADRRR